MFVFIFAVSSFRTHGTHAFSSPCSHDAAQAVTVVTFLLSAAVPKGSDAERTPLKDGEERAEEQVGADEEASAPESEPRPTFAEISEQKRKDESPFIGGKPVGDVSRSPHTALARLHHPRHPQHFSVCSPHSPSPQTTWMSGEDHGSTADLLRQNGF